jgi:hypothetical protein
MKQQDIYIPVDVNERFPPLEYQWPCINYNGTIIFREFRNGKFFIIDSDGYWEEDSDIEFWLEKQDSAIVVTKEELNEMWNVGRNGVYDENMEPIFFKEYIESLGIKL